MAKEPKSNVIEKRAVTAGVVEVRAAAEDGQESRTIEGYAALYNEPTEIWTDWYEQIEPGAFDEADLEDVRCLFNHGASAIVGRTKSGTLEVTLDDKGLKYRCDVAKNTAGNDLLESVRRGDIDQSSFAFRVAESEWIENYNGQEGVWLRKITKIAIVRDVSPVTYPAYEGTSVDARSLPDFPGDAPDPTAQDQTPKSPFSARFADDISFYTTRL